MINNTAARDRLAEIIRTNVPDTVSVQRPGFDAVATFPAVIIGMPTWEPDDRLPYGMERHRWPVAVVVARDGQDSTTIDQLEELWPAVVDLLRTAAHTDQTLGGVCAEAVVIRADFGQFAVQGSSYPAQLISIDLYG